MVPRLLIPLLAIIIAAPLAAAQPPASPAPAPFIGLWVTRYDFRSEQDVRTAIVRSADLGITDVIWQARGQCDAFYKSELEPWGRELFRDLPEGTAAPSFDPLALAVEQAHAHKLKLHAWVNIMPFWKGKTPPPSGSPHEHPFNTHPEWRLHDSSGNPQALNDHYVIVNPLLPAVHDHTIAVCKDIVTRYAIDGLHMDYIRFVSDTMKDPAAYPADPVSIALFEKTTGTKLGDDPQSRAALRDFKRQRITDLVRRIKREAVALRPGCAFTAAIWRRPDLARDSYLQDAAAWLNEGTLDRGLPMIYAKDNAQFAGDLAAWLAAAPGRPITPGLGIYLHDPAAPAGGSTRWQLDEADRTKTAGFALFAYAALFETADPNQDKAPKAIAERSARLELVKAELARRRPITATPSHPKP